MTRFFCPYLGGEVQLSGKREAHIAERHPDLLPEHRERLGTTPPIPTGRAAADASAPRNFSRDAFSDVTGGKHVVRGRCQLGRGRTPLDYYGLHHPEACRRRGRMGAKLSFKYDRDADILHIDKRSPYPEQESEELGDEVIALLNPNKGEVENLEVLFFSTRLLRSELIELPISAELRIAGGE
jgi:hypothetical protein